MTEYISKPKLFDGDGDYDEEGDILSRKLESVASSSAVEAVVSLESLSIHESTTGGVVYKKTSQQAGRQKIDSATDDPLLMARDIEVKYEESLTIRSEDESRIVGAMSDASKKKTSGSFYTLKVVLPPGGKMSIGVKDLAMNILAVSMLKRTNGDPGPAEEAGIRLGDIIVGINGIPCRDGTKTLLHNVKAVSEAGGKFIVLQCWRCIQLCSEKVPNDPLPIDRVLASEYIVQAYSLRRTNVFSDWEMWNFIEILLRHLQDELSPASSHDYSRMIKMEITDNSESCSESGSAVVSDKQRQNAIIDLERNILQAKGLRSVLCTRIVNTKMQADTVLYVIRVEDVESGYQWGISKRYRDFYALNEELSDICHFTREVPFPKKTLPSFRRSNRFIEERIVVLEQYLRKMLHSLTIYATSDPAASRCLRHLQTFLGVDKFIDCMRPPKIDDQRAIEVMTFRFLNDYDSPSCAQCVKFITTVDLESFVEDGPEGYKPVLAHLAAALSEVEAFVLKEHSTLMMSTLQKRRPGLSVDKARTFVRRCVRRQVEAALYLPLRRKVLRIIQPFLTRRTIMVQRAMSILNHAPPDFFLVLPQVAVASSLTRAVKLFRDLSVAYLPADQGQLLMHTAVAIMDLYSEAKKLQGMLVTSVFPFGQGPTSELSKRVDHCTDQSYGSTTNSKESGDGKESVDEIEKGSAESPSAQRAHVIGSDLKTAAVASLFKTSEETSRSNFSIKDTEENLADDFSDVNEKLSPSEFFEDDGKTSVVSADDFLPMFTYILAQSAIPQLLLVKELMLSLVDDEEAYGECGYYMATLEASTQHLIELADSFALQQATVASVEDYEATYEQQRFSFT